MPGLQAMERNLRDVHTQTERLSFVHNYTQTLRPRHRSMQVQTISSSNKKTQTSNDINRPDRFKSDGVRTENEISGFETIYMSKLLTNGLFFLVERKFIVCIFW